MTLAVTWAAAMTAVVFVMAGAMREWKAHADKRDVKMDRLARRVGEQSQYFPNVYKAMGVIEGRLDLVEERNTEAMPAHTHEEIQHVGGRVEQLRDEVEKAQRQAEAAYDLARHVNQLDKTVEAMSVAMTARLTALEQAPPPVIPEPVDVVGVLQAALAPWTRKDLPAEQPTTQRVGIDPDDTPTADPSLIFDPTYDEYPEPVQTVDAVGLPVIPGLPIDIPVANWGLPG